MKNCTFKAHMKHAVYLILFINCLGFSQTSLTANLVKSTPVEWDRFVGIDSFESIYFLKSNALFKKNNQGILTLIQSKSDTHFKPISYFIIIL